MKAKFNKESRVDIQRINHAMAGGGLTEEVMNTLAKMLQATFEAEDEEAGEDDAAVAAGAVAEEAGVARGAGTGSGRGSPGLEEGQRQGGEGAQGGGGGGQQQQQQQQEEEEEVDIRRAMVDAHGMDGDDVDAY
jgi:hypothetical protein